MPLDRFTSDINVFADSRTGREVRQLTDGEFECVAPYMDRKAWSPDDRYIVFMCNRTGAWQPYRMDIATGEAVQLYPIPDAGRHTFYAVAVDAAHNEAYVPHGSTFVAVGLETLSARTAADFAEHFGPEPHARQPVLSGDGRLIYAHVRGEGRAPVALVAPTDNSGHVQAITLTASFTHPCHEQFCPTDDNIITICGLPDYQDDPDADPELRVREWRLERDTGRLRPLVLMPPGQRATHCVWGRSGRRFYFHRKTCPWHVWVPTALCSVDAEGGDLRVYYETSEHRLGHSCPSPDEEWIVTDSQDPGENILMLAATGRHEQHLLCWPNMSIDDDAPHKRPPHLPPHTHRHTHPGFSSTGRYVHYVSDVTGRSQVYIVDVSDLVDVPAIG